MAIGRLPGTVLLIEGVVLVGVSIRESLTGSWLGGVLAGSLGLLFLATAWAVEDRRRAGPGR